MPLIIGIGLVSDFIQKVGGVSILENGELEEIRRISNKDSVVRKF